VLGIRIHVVLVPEKTLAVLLRPARVAILLAQFGRLVVPRLRYPSGLHRLVLVTTVALLGDRYDRGVNHLPATRHVAFGGEVLVKAVEQLLNEPGLGKLLAEQPDRRGIRNAVRSECVRPPSRLKE
jgi:hypothetical protein